MAWHWAHSVDTTCDIWGEETEWHLNWKAQFPKELAEISIENNGIKHRADICFPNETVIEFQHSSLSVEEIRERENFYKNMIWIFDVSESFYKGNFIPRFAITHYTFRWKHARKSIAYASKPVYLDLGNGYIFHLSKMYPDAPNGGSGKIIRKIKLMNNFIEMAGR